MSLLLAVTLVLLGFCLLVWSADILVDNVSLLATRMGVSTFLVGIIVIGFGTSAPELFVSASAALQNKGNLALGNALGSNITNIGLVLGSAAIIHSLAINRRTSNIDIPMMIVAGLLSIVMMLDGSLSRIDGLILLTGLIGYLIWSAKHAGTSPENQDNPTQTDDKKRATWQLTLFSIGSILLLIAASEMLVRGAVVIATAMGISELVIGLTVIAIGTSLPELAAAIAAARRGVHDMIIGNVIGSNIFNTLGVVGLTGAIQATQVETDALWRDFPVMFGFTLFMLLVAFIQHRFNRTSGIVMLGAYFGYLAWLVVINVA